VFQLSVTRLGGALAKDGEISLHMSIEALPRPALEVEVHRSDLSSQKAIHSLYFWFAIFVSEISRVQLIPRLPLTPSPPPW
jgi:hypothetical protein